MKLNVRTKAGWLILLVCIVYSTEFALHFAVKHPLFAPVAFLPGLIPYLVLGLLGGIIGGGICRLFWPQWSTLLFFWTGLAACFAPIGMAYVLENYPGLPYFCGTRVIAYLIVGTISIVITGVLALIGARLTRVGGGRFGKKAFVAIVFVCVPLGVLTALSAGPLGLLTVPTPPRMDQQPMPGAAPSHNNIILISIDTLRADYLPAYGNNYIKTPNIDRLLPGGIVYSQVRSTASFTLAGHAGMLTGRHPAELGILDNYLPLPQGVETIAGALSGAGWATAAVLSSHTMSPEVEIDRGFSHCFTPYPSFKLSYLDFLDLSIPRILAAVVAPSFRTCTNEKTAETALSWLADQGARQPFFLFIHFWGVHAPYRPPLHYYWSENRSDPILSRFTDCGRYTGELLDVDHQVGRVFNWLQANNQWDNTAVILTSDHGEGLGDHGYVYHLKEVYEEQIRVPLIIHPAKPSGKSQVRTELMSTTAIPNIILSQLGVLPDDIEPRKYVRSICGGAAKVAITDGRRKQILVRKKNRLHSYNLDDDPHELKDLGLDLQSWPDLTEPLAGWEIESTRSPDHDISRERKRNLRALGYL